MASKLPIARQIAWLSVIPQYIVMTIIAMFFYKITPDQFIFNTIITYFLILLSLRMIILSKHRKGIRLFRQEKFEEAIPLFQESWRFLKKHAWVDKFRFITMLSSSRISYTEMSLLNEAFCLTQVGKKDEAVKKYGEILKEFPGSEMARAALKMLK